MNHIHGQEVIQSQICYSNFGIILWTFSKLTHISQMLPVSGEMEANLALGLAKTFKVHFLFETHLISFDLIQCTFLKNDL